MSEALAEARLRLAITRRPGCMLVTDLRNSQLAVMQAMRCC